MSKVKTNDEREISKSVKNLNAIKVILLLLFIFSFFTLFVALALISIKTTENKAMIENMWLFFLPLPIPLSSLILGIVYKKKGLKTTKNIVVGIIFTVLLFIYGSFTFIFSGMYSHDFSYVNRIESLIDFDLPDKGDITTQNWDNGPQTGTQAETVHYFYTSDITFTDKDEIAKFNALISQNELWLTYVSTPLLGAVPLMYSYLPSSAQYDYFMIYNVDLKTYNTIPESSGTYKFIFTAYNSQQGIMQIGEYSLDVLV